MKKLTLSIAAIAAMGTFAVAGGDIAPVEPAVETPMVAVSDAGFYVGLGYSYVSNEMTLKDPTNPANYLNADTDHNAGMLQAGYKVNPYFAVEARYWFASSEDDMWTDTDGETGNSSVDYDAWGIYVKPMYPVTDAFDIYALLGYADTSYDMTLYPPSSTTPYPVAGLGDSGFSWGLGAAYDINENFSVFVDYVSLYDDTVTATLDGDSYSTDVQSDSWNFGVTYKF